MAAVRRSTTRKDDFMCWNKVSSLSITRGKIQFQLNMYPKSQLWWWWYIMPLGTFDIIKPITCSSSKVNIYERRWWIAALGNRPIPNAAPTCHFPSFFIFILMQFKPSVGRKIDGPLLIGNDPGYSWAWLILKTTLKIMGYKLFLFCEVKYTLCGLVEAQCTSNPPYPHVGSAF